MEIVARHLKDQALALGKTDDATLFGRSAFNRYYYSAFLLTKQHLLPVLPDLPNRHAAIPEFLQGSVGRELSRRKAKARRVSDHPSVQLTQNARLAAIELAELLKVGYSARVIADYHPEQPIDFYERGLKLNEVRLSEAEAWPHKARHLAVLVVSAFKQTDGY